MAAVRTLPLTAGTIAGSLVLWVVGNFMGLLGWPTILFHSLILILIWRLVSHLYGDWKKTRELRRLLEPTGLYGRGRISTEDDAIRFQLAGRPGHNSFFIGAVGTQMLVFDGESHVAVIAPNAAGKTESLGITNALSIRHNLFVTDKGGEICQRTWRHRDQELQQSVAIINPWRIPGLRNDHFNPLDKAVKLAEAIDPALIDVVRAIILIVIAEPQQSGDNSFFRHAARDMLVWIIIALAYWQAQTGEPVCNFPYLYDIICGGQAEFEFWLHRMRTMEAGDGLLRSAADRLSSRLERSPKTFENILAEAQNGLAIFDRMGPLGQSMEYSDFDPDDLKSKPMTVYLAVPPEKLHGEYAKWAGLVVDAHVRASLSARKLHPRVTYLLDEFSQLGQSPLPSIIPCLYVGRAYGARLVCMVQDRNAFKRYGTEASAFETQCEVTITWGIRSVEDAEWIEKRSGQTSAVTETANLPISGQGAAANGSFSISLSEKAIPVIRRDQALTLPDFKAIVLYKNKLPLVTDLISFRAVEPWAGQAARLEGDDQKSLLPIRFKLKEV